MKNFVIKHLIMLDPAMIVGSYTRRKIGLPTDSLHEICLGMRDGMSRGVRSIVEL